MAKDKVKEAEEAPLEEGAEGDVPAKKKLPLKLIIIGAVAAVLVLGGGGTAAMFLLKPKPGSEQVAKNEKPKKKKAEKKEGGKPDPNAAQVSDGPDGVVYYSMPALTVNMQSSDGRPTVMKLKLTLELPDDAQVEVLNENGPRIQDMFQGFLRELRPEDLNGSQGGYQLRMEIQRRVNLVIAPAKINSVLIEEMLIH
ncbi:flagellar FliL protein [Caulobacter ginsengisoli]|uniref:Flagellar protein FliL n=1 Tax=Caulobacter ginsengisoli TaxID=400775 RepID=A0ABU0IK30_9CAUL|nr:flagellar basal body-associated FliL family protein [Caulobacter ginsengisoli]MDQ0462368.1 flagellar FliL protein [Caulobacter ginsengisoli]